MGLLMITSGYGWSFDTKSDTLTISGGLSIKETDRKDLEKRTRSVVAVEGARADECEKLFAGMKKLVRADLSALDVSKCKSMRGMFQDCESLVSVDLSGWNTANVEDMSYMFKGCRSLEELDLRSMDITNVEDMSYMFSGCSGLERIRTGPMWLPRKVTGAQDMFNECKELRELSVTAWPSASLKDCYSMFFHCEALEALDLSSMDVTNVRNLGFMFCGCGSLRRLQLGGWATYNVEKMTYLFRGCGSLETLDLTGWHVSEGADTSKMFDDVPQTARVAVNDETVARLLPEGITAESCGWKYHYDNRTLVIDGEVPDWRFPHSDGVRWVDGIPRAPWHGLAGMIERVIAKPGARTKTCYRMFAGCAHLKEVDLRELDVSGVRELAGMFTGCASLETVGLNGWDIRSVRHMPGVFEECGKLREADLSGWDVSSVHTFDRFFYRCGSLEKVLLDNWKTNGKARLNRFFAGCGSLSPEAVRCEDGSIRREADSLPR